MESNYCKSFLKTLKHTVLYLCFWIYIDNFLGKYSNGQVWSQQHFWGKIIF